MKFNFISPKPSTALGKHSVKTIATATTMITTSTAGSALSTTAFASVVVACTAGELVWALLRHGR